MPNIYKCRRLTSFVLQDSCKPLAFKREAVDRQPVHKNPMEIERRKWERSFEHVIHREDVPRYTIVFEGNIPYYIIEGSNMRFPCPRRANGFYDPIENTEYYKRIRQQVAEKVERELRRLHDEYGRMRPELGLRHASWKIKERILREEYGINYHSMDFLNPGSRYE